jgi:hypothetical protein
MTLFLPRRTKLQPRRGPLVAPGLCLAPARTPGPERDFDLFASVFQMRPALILPALPFECDVSGRSTDHLLDRALQPLRLVPSLIGATHGQSSSVVVSHGDYPVSGTDNPSDPPRPMVISPSST